MTMNPFIKQSLLRLSDVRSRTGLGKTKIYQLIRDKKFPRPVHPADSRLSGWASLEIDAWIDEQVSAPRQGGAK
jgi:prophage regulatory protein